jgi:hypothetical protein
MVRKKGGINLLSWTPRPISWFCMLAFACPAENDDATLISGIPHFLNVDEDIYIW